ncbi:MAG: hypothetical protein HWE24_16715 [Oceanospirillaceae bacterium]|nr:hypothetical protein [Oceanospirillaceae bacterium]
MSIGLNRMKKANFFWVSFSDLMVSLFFIMLVLSGISFVMFNSKTKELELTIEELESKDSIIQVQLAKYEIIKSVEQNLEPLKSQSDLFIYEPQYKRYKLAFDIQFREGKVGLNEDDVVGFGETQGKIERVGIELKRLVEELMRKKQREPEKYDQISYLIVVTGSASILPGDDPDRNYAYSYNRSYNLYKYWRDWLGIDFFDTKYHDIVEFQIAGNGEGGIGRYESDPDNQYQNEKRNQRFLINVIPKIGEL